MQPFSLSPTLFWMFAESFNRDDIMPFGLRGEHGSPIDRLAIQQYRVRTGESLLVAEFDSIKTEPTQGREQGCGGSYVNCVLSAVDLECDVHVQFLLPLPKRERARVRGE